MQPPAPHRVGEPSPLVFHLSAALAAYGQALLAAPRADSPSFPWADGLGAEAARLGGDLDRLQVAREVAARLKATVDGLELWQRHPYRRALADPPALWRAGCSRLLDYGATPEAATPTGRPLLVVPSLINRAYVLDLVPGRSMLRWLAEQGFRPLLLDWGEPGAREATSTSTTTAPSGWRRRWTWRAGSPAGRCRCSATAWAARWRSGSPRGGRPTSPRSSPSARPGTSPRRAASPAAIRAMLRAGGVAHAESQIEGLGEAFGQVPVSVFQMLFAMVNPIQASLKFQKLARLDPEGPAARLFVALEDWLAEGVPMPAGAARDLLVGWHIRNLTASGGWRFLGQPVDPAAIDAPCLVVSGRARLDRAAAARAAAGAVDPRRPQHHAADRPCRDGRRQPGAAAGVAADRSVPRRPSPPRRRPGPSIRLSRPRLCAKGVGPPRHRRFVPRMSARRPDRAARPPRRGNMTNIVIASAGAHAGRQLQRRVRQHAGARPRRRGDQGGARARRRRARGRLRDHPRPGADRRPGPEPGPPGAHQRRPAEGERRLEHQPGLRLGPQGRRARRPAHRARRRRDRGRRRSGEHVAVARTAPTCAPGRRWAT